MPDARPAGDLAAAVQNAWSRSRDDDAGKLPTYIPQLSEVDPDLFAVAACTTTGDLHQAGDSSHEFTIQSVSKALLFGVALEIHGREAVLQKVGVEPTGRRFDSMLRLANTGRGEYRPFNPLVNSGALAVTSMLVSDDSTGDLRQLLSWMGRFIGREPNVDMPVLLSERETAFGNRAAAYLLRHFGIIDRDVDRVLDLYFHQCSVLVNCEDLAIIAATLAGGGRNPITGDQVLSPEVASDVLAVMSTCGMYDAAGRYMFEIGLPAKSGVSGALITVAPGRMGVAAFSPRLDEQGNSVRGLAATKRLSDNLSLHVFAPPIPGSVKVALQRERLQSTVEEVVRELTAKSNIPLALCAVPIGAAPISSGDTVSAGPVDESFAMQATANAFAYALTIEHLGIDRVHELVGVEPSGNPYHTIVVDEATGRPFNPLGNAGAIAMCGQAPGNNGNERLRARLQAFCEFADVDRLIVDASVLHSEHSTGDRNRAIASLLSGSGILQHESSTLELYFQQCSIRVSCKLLATMAAVLAADGVRPSDGKRLLASTTVTATLSQMYSCGLHDESGRFAFEAGLPAKSGIAGGMIAVVPGQLALAAWSPAVNEFGTSVLGRRALVELSQRLGLSVFLAGDR